MTKPLAVDVVAYTTAPVVGLVFLAMLGGLAWMWLRLRRESSRKASGPPGVCPAFPLCSLAHQALVSACLQACSPVETQCCSARSFGEQALRCSCCLACKWPAHEHI